MSAPTNIGKISYHQQAWIHSPELDLCLILAPAILISLLVLLFHNIFDQHLYIPGWAWVVLIIGIDVAHVYGTLFRTYLNPEEFSRRKNLLIFIPLACWLVGALLYSIDALLFWRVLAYIAVFHFVRQQYGFMAIYARSENSDFQKYRWLDMILIYLAMMFPLIYWHTHLPRNFSWFVENDFLQGVPRGFEILAGGLLLIAALCYLLKEIQLSCRHRFFNIPKNLTILGTILSWNIGIILFNNDLIFTATNVISHGIPYMVLIWIYGHRTILQTPGQPLWAFVKQEHFFSLQFIPLFILFLWILAFLEEGLWDGLVWREHLHVFSLFKRFPAVSDSQTLSWLIPLLTLPQSTHYILDGHIWRFKASDHNN